MAKEYIERETLIKLIFPYGMPCDGNYPLNAKAVSNAIKHAVNADVIEVNQAIAMREKTLQIVEEKQAEIEELTYKLECLLCHATGSKLSKASYTLRTMEQAVTDYINACCYETEAEIKAEAIKEFAERLKESPRKISMMSFTKEGISTYIPVDNIDNLVKEMTEG